MHSSLLSRKHLLAMPCLLCATLAPGQCNGSCAVESCEHRGVLLGSACPAVRITETHNNLKFTSLRKRILPCYVRTNGEAQSPSSPGTRSFPTDDDQGFPLQESFLGKGFLYFQVSPRLFRCTFSTMSSTASGPLQIMS